MSKLRICDKSNLKYCYKTDCEYKIIKRNQSEKLKGIKEKENIVNGDDSLASITEAQLDSLYT